MVKDKLGSKVKMNWKYFSLEQVNNQQESHWKIWEQPEGYVSRGLYAFWAAEAARKQGDIAFQSFHIALLRAKHEKRLDITSIDTLSELAESVNLEMNQFRKDIGDNRLLAKLAEDHTFAVETLGIFGTPTLVFPEGLAIFLKMTSPPSPVDSLSVFTELSHLAERRQYILEIKRPEKPQAIKQN